MLANTPSGRAKTLPLNFLALTAKINTDTGISLTLFFTVLFIYTSSLSPSVYTGDSSLFAAASFSLGTAHPPGYPLYIIIGKLFSFLPIGNVAFKVNLSSAVLAGLACLMVFKTSLLLTKSRAASWAGALICGLSPIFFLESLKAEVYTLNALLAITVFYLGLKALKGMDFMQNTLAALFLIGLGTGGHHTIGLMGLVLMWPVAARWREVTWKWLLLAPVVFAAGTSVNLLMYFRSLAMLEHGSVMLYSYASTWQDLINVILRRAYKSADTIYALKVMASPRGGEWLTGLKNSILNIAAPAILPVLPFSVIGLAFLIKEKKTLVYFIVAILAWFLVLPRIVLSSPEMTEKSLQAAIPYFVPAIPILFSLVSVGFASSIGLLKKGFLKKRRLKIIPGFIPVVLVLLPFVLLPFTIRDVSLNGNFIAHDFGRDILTAMPVKSLLLNYTDNPMFTVFYMRAVERLREDVLVIDTAGKKDTYGMESSPNWKYSVLYPDFYRSATSSVKEINRDFALKGKLFASSAEKMTEVVSGHYSFYPYLLTVALYPKKAYGSPNWPVGQRPRGEPTAHRGAEEAEMKALITLRYRENYPKLNYERIMETPYRPDIFCREMYSLYGFNTMFYGGLLKREGREKEGERFFVTAFSLSNPRLFLWSYVSFLLKDGRKEEAFALLSEVKAGGGGYARLAETVEALAFSAIDAAEAADAEK
ncbi:MAG: DUF2723 domain-containing protein [Thermodesulfovibrionales bacterium]|nr:DUF2723 domain-containing protein [Thermodesulfovibrionales bacterium]